MKIVFALILLTVNLTAFGQVKKLKWSGMVCQFEGAYDARKYTETQLKNTLKLASTAAYDLLFDPTPNEYADIKMLRLENLDAEYADKADELKNLEIVKNPYWETVRQKKLKELEQLYNLKRATLLAYENPSILQKFDFAAPCVKKYAAPLTDGGDALLQIWREVNKASQQRNASPERLQERFDEQLASPEKFQYARMEVMTFGWWNCANKFIEYVESSDEKEAEFKKLFKTVKTLGCEEP
jgi:hypothetical protein